MPFVRVSRDKRGYQLVSLMHAFGRRGSKPRALYVFRTPPGIKVGREPFDDSIRRAIEAQHPGVVFDWKKLSNTPEPPPDIEYWRERRRARKAARQAHREEELAESQPDPQVAGITGGPAVETEGEPPVESLPPALATERVEGSLSSRGQAEAGEGQRGRRRRRRRGRRRGRGPRPDNATLASASSPESVGQVGQVGKPGEGVTTGEAELPPTVAGDSSKEA